MIRKYFFAFVLLVSCLGYSQDFSTLWESHFSYNNVKDISQGHNKIFAASDNAVFTLDTQTNEVSTITTVNGLSGENISAIYYSEFYELLIIGYENGLIEIVFDNDKEVFTVVDIAEKATISPSRKKINHFNPYQNLIYIATNYGISVFDLEKLEFGDTYFIGNEGAQIQVAQTVITDNYIYAACLNGNGLRKAEVSNSNLIDARNWETIQSGSWVLIETLEEKLYAVNSNRRLYQIANDTATNLFLYQTTPLDLRAENEYLIVTTQNQVFVYDLNFNLISQVAVDSSFNTVYSKATVDNGNVYIGTKDYGILKTLLTDAITFEEIHPEGPLSNNPFSIEAENHGVWVTFGEYNFFFNPYPLNSRGYSHLKKGQWINTLYSEVFEAKCLNNIAINPFNNNQVFISSFFSGLLEVNEELPTLLFNQTNSALESLVLPNNPNYIDIRVGATVFDDNGLLWTLTSLVDEPLKTYNPSTNKWITYNLNDGDLSRDLGFRDMVIGSDGTKWMTSYRLGVLGFNENQGQYLLKSVKDEDENMPTDYTTALAIDNNDQLWIGTIRGLRVLYNTSNFFSEEKIQVNEIIIEENGIAKELLFQQYITDIEVDGANNKWIGTDDSGLFYFSPDAQNTIYHFTKDNSPLPTNSVRDVSIDDENGDVYIATSKGLVSFKSGSSKPLEDFSNAYAFPNPVRPHFNLVEDKLKIKNISDNVNIKITDVEGNLVAEAQSRINPRHRGYHLEIDGGTAYWNGKNRANNVVASGVYLVMLANLDTFETKVLKLMVVR